MKKELSFETKVIQGQKQMNDPYNSLTPPLYQTATFVFDRAETGEKRFAGEEEGHIYSRLGNPTVQLAEQKIAALEEAEAALAFGSGMGAVSAVLMSMVKTGSHILCSKGIYGCTFGLLKMLEEKFGVTHSFSELTSIEEIEAAIKPETSCIYIETPINPTMQLIDLETVTAAAKSHELKVIVDNTFCSPYLQQPLLHGCDIVLHSATKYISGHGDVIGGFAAGKKEYIHQLAMTERKDIGAIMSPFDAWLLLRGLKTLPVRMDRHCENAGKIAERLLAHPSVEHVAYPFLGDPKQVALAEKQMKKGGGLITFTLKNHDKAGTQAFINSLELIKIAVSLGDAESLIQHPATMTHSVIPEYERKQMGIEDNLVRLSVGLENIEDIWEDLEQALERK
ncbi:methionine gamma-lyase [Metabacillus hrfriensis]|uniref:Methionine gamma-lyase n=1 Tax=Metabacillus hrfriensis TaxID=3048891 RepID=A0ACD4RII8_9BACI|nr:methionine gamma-lyase [Metabacillus sp. CT-WN-B3]WHZ60321.1 methionine gamma-lyase [Metabacillus sp. CT-WN-B3]